MMHSAESIEAQTGNLFSHCYDDKARDYFELRGVTIEVFYFIRALALARNPDAKYWSMGGICAEIIGNHEILDPSGRWGDVDATQTLTYETKCSLIDTIKQAASCILRGEELKYNEVVGVKANVFVSFTYGNNFIELVDALENYLEKRRAEGNDEVVYFWFDMFVNDQWHALEKDFEWWAGTFKTAVQGIGETVIFLSPWEDPAMLKRAWCLYEISCSRKLSVAVSRQEEESFVDTMRRDIKSIVASLCRIKLENATAHMETDKEQIFEVVEQSEYGFNGFNNIVVGLVRDWVTESARKMISSNDNMTEGELGDLMRTANLLQDQGHLDEAKPMYERALACRERTLGPDHPSTLMSVNNLAILL